MTHPDSTLLAALIVVATPGEAAHLTPLTGEFRERDRKSVV